MQSSVQNSPARQMEEQKNRLVALTERYSKAKLRYDLEAEALTAAKAEAQALFGTDDPVKLRELLKSMQEENEQILLDCTLSLDEVERKLNNLERQVSS